MTKPNIFFILVTVIFFYSTGTTTASTAKGWQEQLEMALSVEDWYKAETIITSLPDEIKSLGAIKNTYALIKFKQGDLKQAQKIMIEIIKSNMQTKMAYENLEKLYSYSAARTYSKGLNLLTPVSLPEFTWANIKKIDNIQDRDNEEKSSTYIDVTQKVPTVIKPEQSKLNNNRTKIKDEINEQLLKWKDSWMKGETDVYIAQYTGAYAPENLTRKDWINIRKKRVSPGLDIQIALSSITYTKITEDSVEISFDQFYQSKSYKDKVRKRQRWIKETDGWKIAEETTLKVYRGF